jgi:hypothetical protein
VAQQTDLPWPERLDAAHFRAVLAREGPVQRQRGLVGPAAIPAVPASRTRLHIAPSWPRSDFNLDATRLRCRPSASPQSPAPEAVVVALPTDARWSVVQWRSVRPALERTDGSRPGASIARPDISESHGRGWIPMRGTRFLPRPGRALDWGSGVGPSEGVGNSAYTRLAGTRGYAAARSRRAWAKSRPNHACAHDPRAAIVARSQLQRKQRLDVVAPRELATRFGERSRRCRGPTSPRRRRRFPRRAPSRGRPRLPRPRGRPGLSLRCAPRAPAA